MKGYRLDGIVRAAGPRDLATGWIWSRGGLRSGRRNGSVESLPAKPLSRRWARKGGMSGTPAAGAVLSGRARRPAAGFRTLADVGAQSSLGLMTAGRFQNSDGEGIVET